MEAVSSPVDRRAIMGQGLFYVVARDEIARTLMVALQRARAAGGEMHLGAAACFGHPLVNGGVV
jgi:hypothetical protein